MTVSFENIPSDILTPGHFVEIDPTGAIEGVGTRPHTALLIGYRLSTGTVSANIPKLITKASTAYGYFGTGSQLAEMAAAFLNVNERTPLWCVGIDEEGAGVAATGTFALTGTATATGVLSAYVGGRRYAVAVAVDDTAADVGTALTAAITADTTAPFTASGTATVTVTYRHKGPEGNDIDLRLNYRATDATPAGLSVTPTAMASGASSPSLSTAIAALAGTQYDTIVTGIADATALSDLASELDTRWGPMEEVDGHGFYGLCDTSTNTISALGGVNSEHLTACAAQESPTAPWIVAADVAAIDAAVTTDDPARPRTTLWCKDILAPASTDEWTRAERNNVLAAGGATVKADTVGNMRVERLTTTYTLNAQGAVDPTWRDLSTKRTVSYLRWSWDNIITRKFPRHKLADDGTNFDAGQAVVTPSTIRAEAIAWFVEMERLGLVEGLDQFREDLVVERNATDLNRIDAILRPDTINKFVVSATKLQFRL